MRYACLHTHTNFCDGEGDVESFCRRAWEKGLYSLGFSSHAPIEKKTGFQTCWNMKEGLLDKYIETVNAAKRRWKDRLTIFLGLEVDFINGLISPADKDYQELGLDYIIGSVHYVLPPHGAPFTVDDSLKEVEQGIKTGYSGDVLAMTEDYWDSVESLIMAGGFDILGHPDLLIKNNINNYLFSEDAEPYKKRIAGVAVLAGKSKTTIEVNTGGMNRRKTESPYPSLPLLKLFRENNVPAVINADAHDPDHLDGHYAEARKTLLEAGYRKTLLFEGKENNRPVWLEEEL